MFRFLFNSKWPPFVSVGFEKTSLSDFFLGPKEKMKERRVALLGLKCWGGPATDAQETQGFEASQVFIRETVKDLAEARQTEKHFKEELDEWEVKVQNASADAPPSQLLRK